MAIKGKNTKKVPNLRFPGFVDEWKPDKLGNLLEFKNGINASKEQYGRGVKFVNVLDILENDYLTYDKIIGSVDVSNEMVAKYSVEYGDILFQRSSETREEVGTANVYLDKEHTATFGGFVIRGKKIGNYDPVFLNKLLKTTTARNSLTSKSGGSTRYNIGQEILSSIELYFPNISEQEKISRFLLLLDERISTQNKIIRELESLIKSIGQKIFHNSHYKFEILNLGAICSIKKGEQINSSVLSESGPYAVMNGGTAPSGYYSQYNCKGNTISISEGGNSCGYVQYNQSKFWSGGHCYTLSKINPLILNKYLYYFLKFSEGLVMSLRVGSGLPNIQKKDLEKFIVRFPDLNHQKKIAAILDVLSQKITTEKLLESTFVKQKQYLLRNMFT